MKGKTAVTALSKLKIAVSSKTLWEWLPLYPINGLKVTNIQSFLCIHGKPETKMRRSINCPIGIDPLLPSSMWKLCSYIRPKKKKIYLHWTWLPWAEDLWCLNEPRALKIYVWINFYLDFLFQLVTFGFVLSQYYSRSENILFNLIIRCFDVVSYGASNWLWTWKFCRKGCRARQFPPDDSPRCDPLWHFPSLPFHKLCKHSLFDAHLGAYLGLSPSLTSLFLQVPPHPQHLSSV